MTDSGAEPSDIDTPLMRAHRLSQRNHPSRARLPKGAGGAAASLGKAAAQAEPEGFTCPECGRTSYHPEDLKQGYCGACHKFTGTDTSRT